MPIAEDSSDPDTGLTGTGTATFTSISFSPPAKSLVVAMVAAEWAFNSGVTTITVANNAGGGGFGSAWAGTFADDASGDGGASGVAYKYFDTAPGSITVRSTYTNFGGGGRLMVIKVLTGANPDQTGQGTATLSTIPSGTNYFTNITTTVAGSIVYGAAQANFNHSTFTANGNSTVILNHDNATDNCCACALRSTNATVTPGSVSIGATKNGTSAQGSLTLVEILPLLVGTPPQQLATFIAVQRASSW